MQEHLQKAAIVLSEKEKLDSISQLVVQFWDPKIPVSKER